MQRIRDPRLKTLGPVTPQRGLEPEGPEGKMNSKRMQNGDDL